MAKSADIAVQSVEDNQGEKRRERKLKQQEKIKELEKRIRTLKK
jgi:hypothetical protein